MSQHQNLQHPHQVTAFGSSKEDLLLALDRADEHVHEFQALLQSTSSSATSAISSGDAGSSPLHQFANELLPAVLAVCDATTSQGQARKLAAVNIFWKLLLALLTSATITEASFTDGTQFILGQLWHGVFSHDWTDPRKNRLAAFFASHLVSAVRAHPDWVVDNVAVCDGIINLVVVLSEAVASESDSSRAKALYTTVLVRLESIAECLGGGAVATGGGSGEDNEEEEEAASRDTERNLCLLERCCCCCGSGGAGAVAPALKPPSLTPPPRPTASLLTLPVSPHSLAHVAPEADKERTVAVVRAIAALDCLLHVVKGRLLRAQQNPQALSMKLARLMLLAHLQWLPSMRATTCELTLTEKEERLLSRIQELACKLPSSALWLSSSSSSSASDDGDDAAASMRTLWVANVATTVALLCRQYTQQGVQAASRALLAALATPHRENVALITEALLVIRADGEDAEGLLTLLSSLCLVGSAACAQAEELATASARQREGDGEEPESKRARFTNLDCSQSEESDDASATAALWAFINAVAIAVGSSTSGAAHPPSSFLAGVASLQPQRHRQPPLPGSDCFFAIADSVHFGLRQDVFAAEDHEDAEEEDGGTVDDQRAAACLACCFHDDALQLAVELEALLSRIVEGDSEDPAQTIRFLQVAPLLSRLRHALEHDKSDGEREGHTRDDRGDDKSTSANGACDSAAAKSILRHRTQQQQQRRRQQHQQPQQSSFSLSSTLSPLPTRASSPPPSLSPTSSLMATANGAFHAVLRSFSGSLSTLTRVLTVRANLSDRNSSSDNGRQQCQTSSYSGRSSHALLASFVAASLLREASFFPLEEPQDQLLAACIRRWVDLSFLLVSPTSSSALPSPAYGGDSSGDTVGDEICVLARHNAARSLMCFAQHNTGLSLEHLRLPEEAAIALVKLLQGGETTGEAAEESERGESSTTSTSSALASSTTVDRLVARNRREQRWKAELAQLKASQRNLQCRLLALSCSNNVGDHDQREKRLLAALATCKTALSTFLETNEVRTETATALFTDSATRTTVLRHVEDIVALGVSVTALLHHSQGHPKASGGDREESDEGGERKWKGNSDHRNAAESDDEADTLAAAVRQSVQRQENNEDAHRKKQPARKGQKPKSCEKQQQPTLRFPEGNRSVKEHYSGEEGVSHRSCGQDGGGVWPDRGNDHAATSLLSSSLQLFSGTQISVNSGSDQLQDDVVSIE